MNFIDLFVLVNGHFMSINFINHLIELFQNRYISVDSSYAVILERILYIKYYFYFKVALVEHYSMDNYSLNFISYVKVKKLLIIMHLMFLIDLFIYSLNIINSIDHFSCLYQN